jgi:hypothetical protein
MLFPTIYVKYFVIYFELCPLYCLPRSDFPFSVVGVELSLIESDARLGRCERWYGLLPYTTLPSYHGFAETVSADSVVSEKLI